MSYVIEVLDILTDKKSLDDLERKWSWTTDKHKRKKLYKKIQKRIAKISPDHWPGEGPPP
jgi:hypothetical protein